jgi:hypothetical protein
VDCGAKWREAAALLEDYAALHDDYAVKYGEDATQYARLRPWSEARCARKQTLRRIGIALRHRSQKKRQNNELLPHSIDTLRRCIDTVRQSIDTLR